MRSIQQLTANSLRRIRVGALSEERSAKAISRIERRSHRIAEAAGEQHVVVAARRVLRCLTLAVVRSGHAERFGRRRLTLLDAKHCGHLGARLANLNSPR